MTIWKADAGEQLERIALRLPHVSLPVGGMADIIHG